MLLWAGCRLTVYNLAQKRFLLSAFVLALCVLCICSLCFKLIFVISKQQFNNLTFYTVEIAHKNKANCRYIPICSYFVAALVAKKHIPSLQALKGQWRAVLMSRWCTISSYRCNLFSYDFYFKKEEPHFENLIMMHALQSVQKVSNIFCNK